MSAPCGTITANQHSRLRFGACQSDLVPRSSWRSLRRPENPLRSTEMHWTKRRERFRAILAGDAASTRARSSTPSRRASPRISASRLACSRARSPRWRCSGAPDLIVLTLSEFAGQAYRINRAGDAAASGRRRSRLRQRAQRQAHRRGARDRGVAALTIEDTALPRPFGQR